VVVVVVVVVDVIVEVGSQEEELDWHGLGVGHVLG
jgi:hypothetical protein